MDDLDGPTQPFTHARIGQLLNAAELAEAVEAAAGTLPERHVDLCVFASFGDAGTPAGMIGSWQFPLAVGVCGDLPPEPEPASVTPEPASVTAQPPIAAPAPVELFEDEVELADAKRSARARWVVAAAAASLALLGAANWWFTRPVPLPPPPPPPPPVVIVAPEVEPIEPSTQFGEGAGAEVAATITDEGPIEFEVVPSPAKKARARQRDKRDSSQCASVKKRADRALVTGDWKQLEQLTLEAECWQVPREAKALRMQALFQLGRNKECMKLGRGNRHESIEKWYKICAQGRG